MVYWNSSVCLAHVLVTELLHFSQSVFQCVYAKPSIAMTNTRAKIFNICRSFGKMLSVVIELVLPGGRVFWQHQLACNPAENY
jgi:hypothetical protein